MIKSVSFFLLIAFSLHAEATSCSELFKKFLGIFTHQNSEVLYVDDGSNYGTAVKLLSEKAEENGIFFESRFVHEWLSHYNLLADRLAQLRARKTPEGDTKLVFTLNDMKIFEQIVKQHPIFKNNPAYQQKAEELINVFAFLKK